MSIPHSGIPDTILIESTKAADKLPNSLARKIDDCLSLLAKSNVSRSERNGILLKVCFLFDMTTMCCVLGVVL